MPDFNYGNYTYFNDNKNKPKSYHKVFILKNEPDFTITPPLEGKLLSIPKLLVKIFRQGILIISKLLLNHKKIICGTNTFRKSNICIMEETKKKN